VTAPKPEEWKPQTQLMTQFRRHAPEGDGKFCKACGFHRDNKLVHPQVRTTCD
jgi:hypothetical protein